MGAEVAVAFVLVLTAALLSRTLWNLSHTATGFTSDRLLTAAVMPGMSGTIPELQDFTSTLFDRITERIARVPGVESVAVVSTAPLGGPMMGMSGVSVVGRPPAGGVGASVSVAVVTPGYFPTMAIRLAAGRDFDRLDRPDRERVAIVNHALAQALGNDVVGERLQFGRSQVTVVGVVGDTPDTSLRERARPFVYVPLAQMVGSNFVFSRLTILARASGNPRALVPAFREAVWSLGHDIVIDEVSTMDERLAAAVRTERDSAALFGLLAAIALLTALVGVYGVVAYSVAQRGREIGIRIALGASARQVVGGLVRESAWPMAAGLVVGITGAVFAARALSSILFEVAPTDPATYFVAALSLIGTALAAAWIPARDAARVDPVSALRAE
jgi:predicted permease